MSTEKSIPKPLREPVEKPLGPTEIAELLVKHYGLHEGFYELMVEFQIGTGPMGPTEGNRIPGLIIGVGKIGLFPGNGAQAITVDAAVVNPAKISSK